VAVTAASGNQFQLAYDSTADTTNINTPTITVPELGLALLGLALVAPFVARRRQREQLIQLMQNVTRREPPPRT
jgi:hypothetical protein